MKETYSISPDGEKFLIPKTEEYNAEFEMLKKRVQSERGKRT